MSSWYRIEKTPEGTVFLPVGSWRIGNLPALKGEEPRLAQSSAFSLILDGSELTELDTSGAMVLLQMLSALGARGPLRHIHMAPEQESILNLVAEAIDEPTALRAKPRFGLVGRIGQSTLELGGTIYSIVEFLGEAAWETAISICRPSRIRLKELAVQLEQTGFDAIPIVALVTFLIGVVLAYLTGVQTEKYGANIFVVDGIGLATCRELSPILVAIIVAGRSGSAFTAQIGAMKLNEEIDALITLGLSPMRVLVIPRLLGLLMTMPLLVFVGDVAGIAGGMMIADLRLGVSTATFIERLHEVLHLKHVLVGFFKAPAFAFFIAAIACRLGMSVEENARSLGMNTTKTVVRSIVSVILLNAAFAVLLSELGI